MSTTTIPQPLPLPSAPDRARRRLRGLVRGRSDDAAWVRPALIALMVGTAVAYLWDLSASGYANSFYAAAVQAGTRSWKAFFFGSLDSSSFITVDKPPASIWVMALSGRIFGFSSMSMLIPQVLEGLAAVALLYAAVKRWFGAGAGLMAGAMLALTPVAALMFRFNNPDALLVCLLVAGAYCLVRALEGASTRWVVAAGTMIGFAFLAKMMQAFLVLPAFGLVYFVAAPTDWRRRVRQLLAGAAAVVVSGGWWVAIVALWPAGSRPFIDGSPDNSILNLILGYNGLGRIFGASGPAGGGGGPGANFSGATGPLRLFNDLMGGQASWLLPAALLALVVGLWRSRRAPRTDRLRAAMLVWGGWLVVTGLVFSLATGVIHTYYTVALAPAIAALVAIAVSELWRDRATMGARAVLALGVLVTAGWSWVLLDRTPQWEPWLRALIAVSAVLAVLGLLAPVLLRRVPQGVVAAAAVLALVACLAGPAAFAAQTITTAHSGSIPSAGPSAAASGPGGFGGGGGGGAGQSGTSSSLVKLLESGAGRYRWVATVSGSQSAATLELATGGEPVMAIGGFNNQGGQLTLQQFKSYVSRGEIHYYVASAGGGAGGFPAGGRLGGAPGGGGFPAGGGQGGRLGGPPAGGFPGSGTGGAPRTGGLPTGGGAPGGPGGSSTSAITAWVKAHYTALTVDGQTVYDLTQAKA